MVKYLSYKSRLALFVCLILFSSCRFVQPPAPVELPKQSSPNKGSQTAATINTDSGAQTTPYRAPGMVRPAPAGQAAVPSVVPNPADQGKTHIVAPGENLFRIALRYGLTYQVLANWNQLTNDNVKVGQVLRLSPPTSTTKGATAELKRYPKGLKLIYSDDAVQKIKAQSEAPSQIESSLPAIVSAPSAPQASNPVVAQDAVSWEWPCTGKIVRPYSDSAKGMDIAGEMGQAIFAAASGKVVYSGSGLRAYGKLIIIRHNKAFLSAYAYNSRLLVKEGMTVKKGQKIAEMGQSDTDQVKLHFEIRRFGKPINPLDLLPPIRQ